MGYAVYTDSLNWVVADGTAVANTTTETIVFPDIPIQGYYLNASRHLKMEVFGKLSTTGTPTVKFRARWGGVAGVLIAESEALTCGSGVTDVNWYVSLNLQTRSGGASGSMLGMGVAHLHTAAGTVLTNVFGISGYDAPTVATIDTTIVKLLSFTVQWSAASASNTLTGLMQTLQAIN